MARQDAMEQVKEAARLAIKYRFWIAVSAAALLGLIAYFLGAGPIQEAAKKETATITKAETDVKGYASPALPNKDYQPLVQEQTAILTKDVNTAWKVLYDRQAPLLTWPETVQERFGKWGRKWPTDVDPGKVTLAQVDYIAAYKDYVDMVYKTCKPFDYETGEGIVAAPPRDALLRPAEFSDEQVPGLSKIWSAQERLWIQRTLLDVVREVNKNAKDWNSAIIRQIVEMEVGNPDAQDQHSLAKNEILQEAEAILAPGEVASRGAAGAPAAANPAAPKGGARKGGMGGGAGAHADSENVYYVKAGNEQQYRILPVQMTVLIDEDHVQDLLVELENSPMSIDVKEFELQRPTGRVVKPEKGTAPAETGGEARGMNSVMRSRGIAAYGGAMGGLQNPAGRRMGISSAPAAAARKGTDVRGINRADQRKQAEEKVNQAKGPSLFDPYFNIVEVTVYGQARFFKPPPPEGSGQPSLGQAPAIAGKPAATAAPAATAVTPARAAVPAPAPAIASGPAGTPGAISPTNPTKAAQLTGSPVGSTKPAPPTTPAAAVPNAAKAADPKARTTAPGR